MDVRYNPQETSLTRLWVDTQFRILLANSLTAAALMSGSSLCAASRSNVLICFMPLVV